MLSVMLMSGVGVAAARSNPRLRAVSYHGYTVTVPSSWPVYELANDPHACVRFNRHALYLGTPGADQRCPANAVGRTEAILIEPVRASAARAGGPTGGGSPGGAATSFVVSSAGVEVTATWLRDRRLVALALHRPQLHATGTARPRREPAARVSTARARTSAVVYTGLGFDACYAPSSHAMSAWASSPYRALGIYIGGANAACPPSRDPNLTPTWLSNEAAAGWRFIPTYVGLQAPSNSCGCAGIKPSQASAEGTAAAEDAVAQAQSLGIGPGNPIFDDMEFYTRNTTNSSAVLGFLSAWTSQLHASGYLSGVYGNADSAITDLVNEYGTGYVEPDDVWIADWNGQQTTGDPYVPNADWANHQRLHQYRGGHNETYGGVTINIDSNYLDGATASIGAGSAQAPPAAPPALSVLPTADGTTNLSATWSNGSGLASWRVLAGSNQTALSTVASASARGSRAKISVRSAASYFAVQALGSAGQVLASSSTVPSPAHMVLYGHSAFVNQATGTGGIPAGCYTGTTCHIATTISAGRTTIARTGTESVQPGSTAILFFTLTSKGRALLRRASGGRLAVKVSARDRSGTAAVANLALIPFSTAGRGPGRSVSQSGVARIVGVTDFVFSRGAGGILAGCETPAPCPIAATLSVGRTQIAVTRPELVGGGELGYLFFSLTPRGRSLLTHAPGNQLGTTLTISSGSSVATARIALVQFS
jgi:Domain of unknown function (DUF1906)